MNPITRAHRQSVAERDWRLKASQSIQTCAFCGRSIEPTVMFYRDVVSGHLNAHKGCLATHRRKECEASR